MRKTTLLFGTGLMLVILLGGGLLPTAAEHSGQSGTMLVYDGNSRASYIDYTKFADAADKDAVESSTLGDLHGYDCVLLNMNQGFTSGDLDALAVYVLDGGRLIVVSDAAGFAGSTHNALNSVTEAVGSTIRIAGGSFDPGYRTTQNIGLSTLTLGTVDARYAYFAEIETGAAGHVLVRNEAGDRVVAAAQQVGTGFVVVSGDSNLLSNNDGGGYANNGNAQLAFNACNGLVALGLPV